MAADLFEHVFGTDVVDTSGAAIVDAMCSAEAALARACAQAGLVSQHAAAAVAAACDDLRTVEVADLARRSVEGGNPVIPLVADLRRSVQNRSGAEAARAVHLGATSQDILDTALMLVALRAVGVIDVLLGTCADRAAALAGDYRTTAMSGRTLLQQAVPTTFGAVAAGWGSALDRARERLVSQRAQLPAQLGGAAGTLAPLGTSAPTVVRAYAAQLGLAEPDAVWHTDRAPITELAAALAGVAVAVAKTATDLVLLAQDEIGEVRERRPGGSSAMAHKHNAIGAVTARAAAMQVPGLVSTLLVAAAPELQRGAGSWHAEWPALLSLLEYSAGCVSRLRAALDVDVDVDAMTRNLMRLDGVADIADVGNAPSSVDRYLERRMR